MQDLFKMKRDTYALSLTSDLLDELRRTSKETGLSIGEAMRQSMKLGLPKLREMRSESALKPFNSQEIKAAFKPDKEWEAVESAMTDIPALTDEG